MANRYLRGTGARNWNDTANWGDTSGGAGGASVPTATDNVIFDANSGTGTITVNGIANMLDFTCSNIAALTLSNAAYAFNVYGSLTLHTNLTVTFTSTAYLYLKATDSRTITTNGKVANWNRLYFDGVGGTLVNQDDMNVSACGIYVNAGTWNTNSKLITGGLLVNAGTATRGIVFGSSVINLSDGASLTGNSGMSFDFGTSTIKITGSFAYFYVGSTQYDIEINRTGSIVKMWGINCRNLTRNSGTSATGNCLIGTNITVSTNLILLGGNANNQRLLVDSDTIGTTRTITCNGTVTASNVDFRDIILAGTCNKDLSVILGGSGDCGGNSGITFTTAQPQYFKHTSGACSWSDATKWFSDLTPRITTGRVPLPQDDATFDGASFTGASTLSVNCPRIGRSLDMSSVNQAVTFSLANDIECYGSFILGNNISTNANNLLSLLGRGVFSINLFNKNIYRITQNCVNGTYTALSNIYLTTSTFGALRISSGTFNLNNYNLDIETLFVTSGTLNCGNGIIRTICTFRGIGVLTTGGTINFQGSTLILVMNGAYNMTLDIVSNINKLQLSGTIVSNFIDITNSNTIAELIIDSGRKVRFTAGTTQTVGKVTAIGTQASPITLESVTAGSRFNLTYTGVNASTVEYCSIKDSKVNQARRLLAKNSTNAGNNQNWGFDTLPPFALNTKQVDKIYYGSNQVSAMYIGTNKIY